MANTIGQLTANDSLLRNLQKVSEKETESLKPLASGKRINSAKDDAAGLVIAQQLLTELTALDQSARNASDGISLLQVADGGLDAVSNNLNRIRELTVQSANGTLGDEQRSAIQTEVSQLQEEITNTLESGSFNGIDLFKNNINLDLQVGSQASDKLSVALQDVATPLATVAAIDVSTAAGADSAFAVLDTAIDVVNAFRGDLGAASNRVESAINNIRSSAENTAASKSRILDTDFALAVSEQVRQSFLRNAGNSVQAQANASSQLVLGLLS